MFKETPFSPVRTRQCLSAAKVIILTMGLYSQTAFAKEPFVTIEGDAPVSVQDLLTKVLGEVEAPPRSRAQARRRAEKALEEAGTVLRSQGYYGASVENIVPVLTADEDVPQNRTPVIKIIAGPQFKYKSIKLNFDDETPKFAGALQKQLDTQIGKAAYSADILAYELNVTTEMRQKGYPDVIANPRRVIVDHSNNTVTVIYNIASGDFVKFGNVQLSGNAHLSPSWPKIITPFQSGEHYDERKLGSLTRNVINSRAFKGASSTLAPFAHPNPDGTVTRDVMLNIEQGKNNTISGELGVSTTDGAGIDIEYERRNLGKFAQILTVKSTVKTNQISLGVNYNIPYAWRLDRALDIGAEIAKEDTEALNGERLRTYANVTQSLSDKLKVSLGAGFEASRFLEDDINKEALIVEGLGKVRFDQRDSLLDPTKGFYIEGDLIPSYNFGDENDVFVAGAVGGNIYRRLSRDIILAGRVKAGSIIGASLESIPLNRRYFAGGGGSVRGYEYQSISPVDSEGDEIGGRSIIEGSAEIRFHSNGPWGFTGFIDAGTVGQDEFGDFETVRLAVGTGVRYHTRFAPLRVDLALPINKREGDRDFQIYMSIGQSF